MSDEPINRKSQETSLNRVNLAIMASVVLAIVIAPARREYKYDFRPLSQGCSPINGTGRGCSSYLLRINRQTGELRQYIVYERYVVRTDGGLNSVVQRLNCRVLATGEDGSTPYSIGFGVGDVPKYPFPHAGSWTTYPETGNFRWNTSIKDVDADQISGGGTTGNCNLAAQMDGVAARP